MKLEQIDRNRVLIPENELEREILQRLLMHMKPDYAPAYWDVTSNSHDPMSQEDRQGKFYVSWDNAQRERRLDTFSICRADEGGYLTVVKNSKA